MSSLVAQPGTSRYSKINWLTAVVLVVFHVLAVVALFQFTWTNLLVAAVLYWVAVGLGISMGYHRLHTHRGFKTPKLFEYFLAVCGTLTLEGGPIFWVAIHRQHHQHSDQPLDPHTPRVSGFWSHLGWVVFGEAQHNDTAHHVALRAGPRARPLLPLADHLSLGAADRRWDSSCWPSADGRWSTGRSSCASSSACTPPGSSTPPRTCGDAAGS